MKNTQITLLIQELKKESSKQKMPLWKRIASDLEKPTRQRRIVNLSKINRYCKENDIVIVPGKVLGTGELDKKLTIAAYKFSESATEKIKNAKGTSLELLELLQKKPDTKNIKIIG